MDLGDTMDYFGRVDKCRLCILLLEGVQFSVTFSLPKSNFFGNGLCSLSTFLEMDCVMS